MWKKNLEPYISIIFVNRNDLYTSDQINRVKAFIEFYSFYDKKYPNLFEFLICDWNPLQDRKSLKDQYDWTQLSLVKHLVVSPEIHSSLCPDNSHPILDYTGRNACIRRASAPFILVINQDIFLSSSILDFLAKRMLSEKYFYRADRCDFEFDYKEGFSHWENFDTYAIKNVTQKHIRPKTAKSPMSLQVNSENFNKVYTHATFFERKVNGVIYSNCYSFPLNSSFGELQIKFLIDSTKKTFLTKFFFFILMQAVIFFLLLKKLFSKSMVLSRLINSICIWTRIYAVNYLLQGTNKLF